MKNGDAADGKVSDALDRCKRHEKFWRKYLRLTRAGIMVLRALQIIAEEEYDKSFRKIIDDLRAAVEAGKSLSSALQKHDAEFSLSEIELVKIAEKRGAWDEVLEELTEGLRDGTFL